MMQNKQPKIVLFTAGVVVLLGFVLFQRVFRNYILDKYSPLPKKAGEELIDPTPVEVDNQTAYYLNKIPELQDQCELFIKNSQSQFVNISKAAGLGPVLCFEGYGRIESPDIKNVLQDGRLLISRTDGEALIYDAEKKEKQVINFDSKFSLLTSNLVGDLFLYKSSVNQEDEIVVSPRRFSKDHSLSFKQDYLSGYVHASPYYDSVNQGFVLILVKQTFDNGENYLKVRIYFYNYYDNKRMMVLDSGKMFIRASECGGTRITSKKPGEILLLSDCLAVERKYLNSDGEIQIKLK